MEALKLILITFLPAIAVGCIFGVVAGRHKVKKEAGQVRSILNTRQRIMYSVSIVLGIACILFGIFYMPGNDTTGGMGDGVYEGDFYDPGMMDPGMTMPEGDMTMYDDGANPDLQMPDENVDEPLDEDPGVPDGDEPTDEDEPAAEEPNVDTDADGAANNGGGAVIAQPKPAPMPRASGGGGVAIIR